MLSQSKHESNLISKLISRCDVNLRPELANSLIGKSIGKQLSDCCGWIGLFNQRLTN
jgi:hypothetical protein